MRRFALATGLLFCLQLYGQNMSPGAQSYIEAAVRIMQDNFVHRGKIDWEQLRRDTLSRAAGAQTTADTYEAIRFALAQLGDYHSYLQLTPELARSESSRRTPRDSPPQSSDKKAASPFQDRRIPEGSISGEASHGIGRIVIPSFSGQDLDGFATRVQALIADVASKRPCGWVVDLRGNGGGNMWPMLAGVGPILGDGEVGAFVDYTGGSSRWFYEDGSAVTRSGERTTTRAKTSAAPIVLPMPPPVGVLIDAGTGSSGEAIAVAFRGRSITRFFGETTYGVANSTFPYTLSDGAQLFLVVAVDLDRNGTEYPSGVQPDQTIAAVDAPLKTDVVFDAAARWLLEQRACR